MLAAALLALAAAPHHPAPHAAGPARLLRAVVVSGNRQTARSYVAQAAKAYDAQFAAPLIVRIEGPTAPKGHPRHVIFTCERCIFAPAEQHEFDGGDDTSKGSEHAKDDNGKTIPSAYDSKPIDGRIGIYVVLEAPVVAGTYRVRAEPVPNKGEKAVATWFTLTTR